LHEDNIAQAVDLEEDQSESADLAESQGDVELYGSPFLGITDARHHLAITARQAIFDERAQQQAPQSKASGGVRHVDRIFYRMAVGGAGSEWPSIGDHAHPLRY
jgi:hypothetical protein